METRTYWEGVFNVTMSTYFVCKRKKTLLKEMSERNINIISLANRETIQGQDKRQRASGDEKG